MASNNSNKKRRRFPRHLIWILATFLILLVGISLIMVGLGLNHPYFQVDTYIINGNISKSDEEIEEEISGLTSKSIFALDVEEVEAAIHNMGNLESVEVKKIVPDTLSIDIVEDEYIGYIQVDNGYLLIEANLKVEDHVEFIPEEEMDDLFKISNAGYDVLTLSNDVSALDREMTFLKDLINHPLRKITSEVDFGSENGKAIIKLSTGTIVDFGELKETDYKIALTEKIVSDLQSKNVNAKEIILDGTNNPIVITD